MPLRILIVGSWLLLFAVAGCSVQNIGGTATDSNAVQVNLTEEQAGLMEQGDRLLKASRYDDASTAYREVFALQRADSNSNAAATYLSLYKLATIAEIREDYNQAIGFYKQARNRLQQDAAANRKRLKHINGYLGVLFLAKGMLGENRSELKKQLSLYQRISQNKHPNIGFCQHQLGRLALAASDTVQAELYFKKSIAFIQRRIGADHPYLAVVMNDYADLLDTLNRHAEAARTRQQCAAIKQAHPEKQHAKLYLDGVWFNSN